MRYLIPGSVLVLLALAFSFGFYLGQATGQPNHIMKFEGLKGHALVDGRTGKVLTWIDPHQEPSLVSTRP